MPTIDENIEENRTTRLAKNLKLISLRQELADTPKQLEQQNQATGKAIIELKQRFKASLDKYIQSLKTTTNITITYDDIDDSHKAKSLIESMRNAIKNQSDSFFTSSRSHLQHTESKIQLLTLVQQRLADAPKPLTDQELQQLISRVERLRSTEENEFGRAQAVQDDKAVSDSSHRIEQFIFDTSDKNASDLRNSWLKRNIPKAEELTASAVSELLKKAEETYELGKHEETQAKEQYDGLQQQLTTIEETLTQTITEIARLEQELALAQQRASDKTNELLKDIEQYSQDIENLDAKYQILNSEQQRSKIVEQAKTKLSSYQEQRNLEYATKDKLFSKDKTEHDAFIKDLVTQLEEYGLNGTQEQLLDKIHQGLDKFPGTHFQSVLHQITLDIIEPDYKPILVDQAPLNPDNGAPPLYKNTIEALHAKITALQEHGNNLKDTNEKFIVTNLAMQLRHDVNTFVTQNKTEYTPKSWSAFNTKFTARLHSHDDTMSKGDSFLQSIMKALSNLVSKLGGQHTAKVSQHRGALFYATGKEEHVQDIDQVMAQHNSNQPPR